MTDNTTIMALPVERPTWGVWIPGQGWLRCCAGGQIYAETLRDKARRTAQRIGRHARIEYIDKSLIDLQEQFLWAERYDTWRYKLMQFFIIIRSKNKWLTFKR